MKVFLFIILMVPVSCRTNQEEDTVRMLNGTFHIQVMPEQARDGKLSEFFEQDIDYVWFNDDREDALIAVIHRLVFYKNRYYLLDRDVCECFYIFDDQGKFIRKVKRQGDGPGNYLQPSSFQAYNDQIILFDAALKKWLHFDLDGNWLRDISSPIYALESFIDSAGNYFLYKGYYLGEDKPFQIWVFDEKLERPFLSFPFDPEHPLITVNDRKFTAINEGIVYSDQFEDSVSVFRDHKWHPHVVFDFLEKGISKKEVSKLIKEGNLMHMLNKERPLFHRNIGFINDRWLFSLLLYKDKVFTGILDKLKSSFHMINNPIRNDIDSGLDIYNLNFLDRESVWAYSTGKDLYEHVQQLRADMGDPEWEDFVKGRGKKLVRTAFNAKDSENRILIILKPKKLND